MRVRGTITKMFRRLAYGVKSIRTATYGIDQETGQVIRTDKEGILYQRAKKAYVKGG